MKVLYVGLRHNYGKKEEGPSYEHVNIEAGFRDCDLFNVDIWHPDVPDMMLFDHQWGKLKNINDLVAVIGNEYDAIFHVAFNESLDLPQSIAKLALKQDIPVIQWDCDSSWRFNHWILPRKNRVSHFVTTHSATIPWYQQNDMNVIRSQWAGSPLYYSKASEKTYDITFIGQRHGQMPNGRFVRSEIIDAIISAGIKIDLFGNYWDGYDNWHGYLTEFNDVIDVFDKSKIALNLSNPWYYNTMPQIKGRHFEIPQMQVCQISTPADDLISYFEDGKEIIIAHDVQDLIYKVRYYLDHDNEREAIAKAGYKRMLQEHQWRHRFEHIFKTVGIL